MSNAEERIAKINITIEQINKALELRKLQAIKFNQLKHSLMQQARALNPVFWLEGKKITDLKILYKQEQELRKECGLKPMLEGIWLNGEEGVRTLKDWVVIEKSKWEKNKINIDSGVMIA